MTLSTVIHRNPLWSSACLGTVVLLWHWNQAEEVPPGGRCHEFTGRSSSQPVPGRNPLRHGRSRARRGSSPHPFAISRISRRPPGGTAKRCRGADAISARTPASPHVLQKIISSAGTARAMPRWMSSAGWRAPQPPTPHPSGERPWPFGRRGLLLCASWQRLIAWEPGDDLQFHRVSRVAR